MTDDRWLLGEMNTIRFWKAVMLTLSPLASRGLTRRRSMDQDKQQVCRKYGCGKGLEDHQKYGCSKGLEDHQKFSLFLRPVSRSFLLVTFSSRTLGSLDD